MKEFAGFGEFAAFLTGRAFMLEDAQRRGLDKAGEIVEAEAKREIGAYQDGAGPFVAWAELADATKADRVSQGYEENQPGLRSGEMRDSVGHEVSERTMTVGSDDQNLVYFELGTSKQPPRSVLGGALFRKRDEAVDAAVGEMIAVLTGEFVG